MWTISLVDIFIVMSESKESYIKKITTLLRKSYSDYLTVANKEELTDDDQKKLSEVVKTVKFIEPQKKVIKELPSNDIVIIKKLSFLVNELKSAFSYDLGVANNTPNVKSRRKSTNEGHNLMVKNFTLGKILNRNTFNINDDVTNFTNDPIFTIERQAGSKSNGGFIHSLKNELSQEYNITFSFNLSRFPSKTFQNSSSKFSMKQITTRRTDLLKFKYGNTEIEFGAMAPMGIFVDPKQTFEIKEGEFGVKYSKQTLRDVLMPLDNKPYSKIYSQFSIACCINVKKGTTLSLSTDYKFELGKNYVVTLTINNNNNEKLFGESEEYSVKMNVNGIDEETSIYMGKVWGKNANRLKNNNKIPSQPKFRYRLLPKFINKGDMEQWEIDSAKKHIDDQIKNNLTHKDIYSIHYPNISKLNVNNLVTIVSVPYDETGKNIYNKKTYKVNRGVSFKNIDISYK